MTETVDSKEFYAKYHGHSVSHLKTLFKHFKSKNKNFIFLVGDSSLDNKFWISSKDCKVLSEFESILHPPFMKPDVAYHLNSLLCERFVALNCAVEESTVEERNRSTWIHPQDQFVSEHIGSEDMLIVSIAGNDVALKPSAKTMWYMGLMFSMNSLEMIRKGPSMAWGMSHFIDLFKNQIESYILKLIPKDLAKRPKKILVCMIYYPLMTAGAQNGWAKSTLDMLGYFKQPTLLQEAIQQLFIHATSQISIPGSKVIPVPLYESLDGKDVRDYVALVEPSNSGGRKMAEQLISHLMK